jgi:hypothetical protein
MMVLQPRQLVNGLQAYGKDAEEGHIVIVYVFISKNGEYLSTPALSKALNCLVCCWLGPVIIWQVGMGWPDVHGLARG